MSDHNIVDIRSRKRRSHGSNVLALAEQLIAMEGIRETVALLADISHDFASLDLFEGIPSTPEIRKRVHDIIWETVVELEHVEASLRETQPINDV